MIAQRTERRGRNRWSEEQRARDAQRRQREREDTPLQRCRNPECHKLHRESEFSGCCSPRCRNRFYYLGGVARRVWHATIPTARVSPDLALADAIADLCHVFREKWSLESRLRAHASGRN